MSCARAQHSAFVVMLKPVTPQSQVNYAGFANAMDPDQTAPRSSLISIHSVSFHGKSTCLKGI